jgi:hypothetical protein
MLAPDPAGALPSDAFDALLHATAPIEPAGFGGAPEEEPNDRREARRSLERESTEVTAAILAVGAGRAPWVMVCGLRRPRVVVEALRGLATQLALDVELVARPAGAGLDVVVRPHRR